MNFLFSYSKFFYTRRQTAAQAPKSLQVDIDMPVDPNEPTYCFCNRVSFGEMVGCDNPDVS